jgi:hypothetical protein
MRYTEGNRTMKTLLIAVIACALPFVAGAQDNNNPPFKRGDRVEFPAYSAQDTQVPLSPTPNWRMVAAYYGPNIPFGWQVINIESVIQDGTSVTAWLIYLYNPTTHQTAGWLISLQ